MKRGVLYEKHIFYLPGFMTEHIYLLGFMMEHMRIFLDMNRSVLWKNTGGSLVFLCKDTKLYKQVL